MGLDITQASVGVDVAGMKKLYDDIKVNLIEEAEKKIKEDALALFRDVSNYWEGEGANAFKFTIAKKSVQVCALLHVSLQKIESDLATMAANAGKTDEEVQEAIATMDI